MLKKNLTTFNCYFNTYQVHIFMDYLIFSSLANFTSLFLGKLPMHLIFLGCSVSSLKICSMYEPKNIACISPDKLYLHPIIKLPLFFICFWHLCLNYFFFRNQIWKECENNTPRLLQVLLINFRTLESTKTVGAINNISWKKSLLFNFELKFITHRGI